MEIPTPSSTSVVPLMSCPPISTIKTHLHANFPFQPPSPTAHKSTPPYQVQQQRQQTLPNSHLSGVDLHQHAATSSTLLTRAHKSQQPPHTIGVYS